MFQVRSGGRCREAEGNTTDPPARRAMHGQGFLHDEVFPERTKSRNRHQNGSSPLMCVTYEKVVEE